MVKYKQSRLIAIVPMPKILCLNSNNFFLEIIPKNFLENITLLCVSYFFLPMKSLKIFVIKICIFSSFWIQELIFGIGRLYLNTLYIWKHKIKFSNKNSNFSAVVHLFLVCWELTNLVTSNNSLFNLIKIKSKRLTKFV